MREGFFCRHCMGTMDADDYPAECSHCHVGLCVCGTRLKANSQFCYGCGTVNPTLTATMYRGSSTAAAYASMAWQRDGLGSGCAAVLTIAVGWDNIEDMTSGIVPHYHRIVQLDGDPSVVVRDLTDDEIKTLGYPEWVPK